MRALILLCVVAAAYAQYEGGFVKILQDKRYQDGNTFGNYREQEDGVKYFEETDAHGIRRGYYEYPSGGQTLRTEFEAGPGIGFRILKSTHVAPTTVADPMPQYQPIPQPQPAPQPQPQPHHEPQPHYQPQHVAPVHVPTHTPHHSFQPTPQPAFENLFNYPGNLEFSRSSGGHRFKFTAV